MRNVLVLPMMAFVVWGGWAQAPAVGTVGNLISAVRSELQARQSDEHISRMIEAFHLTEKLDDEVIEQLETEGAGRLTVDTLERQRDVSHSLPPPAMPLRLFEAAAVPSGEEQARVLEQARVWVLQYTANLPNFLCVREVSRYTKRKDPARWQKIEGLTWELSYSDRKDYQKLVSINGKPTKRRAARGTSSGGEFGGVMNVIFQLEPKTRFQWLRWSNLGGRPTHVFSFFVDEKNAAFGLVSSGWINTRRTATAMRGSVYIDHQTHHIMRVIYDAEGMPSDFPVLDFHTVVDYGHIEIGTEKFLLPVRSTLRAVTKKQIDRNVTDFSNYRKFTSEVKVEFEKQ